MIRLSGVEKNPLLFYLGILVCITLITSCKQDQSKSASEVGAKKPIMSQGMAQSSDMEIIPPHTTAELALDPDIEKNLDPALKKKVTELLDADRSYEPVQMIGKYAYVEASNLKRILSELGCSAGMVTASFFTVECPASAVFELAGLEFIEYLELSKERYLY